MIHIVLRFAQLHPKLRFGVSRVCSRPPGNSDGRSFIGDCIPIEANPPKPISREWAHLSLQECKQLDLGEGPVGVMRMTGAYNHQLWTHLPYYIHCRFVISIKEYYRGDQRSLAPALRPIIC